MTIILLTSIVTTIVSLLLYKPIHKYRYVLYAIAGVLALVLHEDSNVISLGYVPFGIFLVVMYSGVLEKGIIRKRLFMVRAELGVIASLLIAPHGFGYLEYFLDDIGILNANLAFFIGIVAILTMIPLFITSFRLIRKKMKYKEWKHLHQLAYLFYILVGLHLILIQNDRMWLYIILFGTYFFLHLTPKIVTQINQMKQQNPVPTK